MPDLESILPALGSGLLIGASVSLLLLGAGRIAGISGIWGSAVQGQGNALTWLFLAGLLAAPWLAAAAGWWERTDFVLAPHWPKLVLAGLLVGVGTQLGGGCTSGHGVCGMSRLSPRSITATLVFMAVAALVVGLGFGGLS